MSTHFRQVFVCWHLCSPGNSCGIFFVSSDRPDGFYASWQVAFVIMAVIPFASITALMVMKLNQSKSTRQAAAYKSASSIAYSAVSSIKTVLSLNAVQTMINHYRVATQEAYNQATGILIKQGFWNGEFPTICACALPFVCFGI